MDRYWQTVREEEARMTNNDDDRRALLSSPDKEPCPGVLSGVKHFPHWWHTAEGKRACLGLPEVVHIADDGNGITSVYDVDDKYVQRMYDVATWGQVRTSWDKLTEGERAGFTSAIKVAYREGFHMAMRNVADHVRAQQKDT